MYNLKKSWCCRFLVFLLVSGFLVFSADSGLVLASTDVPSIISADTVWTKAESPYEVKGPVLVSSGVVLAIEAGTVVNLNSYYIEVNGTLSARGTSSKQVKFVDGEVRFTQFSSSYDEQTGAGCVIEYADLGECDLIVSGSTKIAKNSIRFLAIDGSATVTENTIFRLSISRGSSWIVNNSFPSSTPFDVSVGDSSAVISSNYINCRVRVSAGSPTISHNTINDGIHVHSTGGAVEIVDNVITIRGTYYVLFVRGASATISGNIITGMGVQTGVDVGSYTHLISDNTITNCETAINGQFYLGEATIERNTLTNNHDGLKVYSASEDFPVAIRNNIITDNTGTGIYIDHISATVKNNTIANNSIGIEVRNTEQISYNNIYDNGYNLKVAGGYIEVPYNYWGTTDSQTINQTIYDKKYDFTAGAVNYEPYLTEPNTQIPEYPTTALTTLILTTALIAILYKKQLNKKSKL